MKHITLKQEKTSALELKTFCSWSLNTVNVWYSEGGKIKLLGCKENGNNLVFLFLWEGVKCNGFTLKQGTRKAGITKIFQSIRDS